MSIIIAPSVLSLDYTDTKKQLQQLKESNAKWLHFDVMDAHFVPNISFGPDILKACKKSTGMFMDVHLMMTHPQTYYKNFIAAGADMITFHYEAMETLSDCIKLIKEVQSCGCKAGIVLKPNTSVDAIVGMLDIVDMVLIMSVEPGFGGQSFMPSALDKIKQLKAYKQQHQSSFLIQIDGGINKETGALACQAGCEVLVAGSYIFNQDICEGVDSLLCLK